MRPPQGFAGQAPAFHPFSPALIGWDSRAAANTIGMGVFFMSNAACGPHLAVLGGDLRQAALARALWERGSFVHSFFFDAGDAAPPLPDGVCRETDPARLPLMDAVILPLPVSTDGEHLNAPFFPQPVPLGDCLERVGIGAVVLGGMPSPAVRQLAQDKGVTVLDYAAREELAVANAVPTAEGALQLAMQELPITLWQSRCLVTGYGRIARVLCRYLRALGAQVTVAARSLPDLAWARAEGMTALPLEKLPAALPHQQVVFSTVPARLFGEAELSLLPPGCLLMDLASRPGGVDQEAARRLGVRTIWALALPGKTAPDTAGQILADTVHTMLTERGVL